LPYPGIAVGDERTPAPSPRSGLPAGGRWFHCRTTTPLPSLLPPPRRPPVAPPPGARRLDSARERAGLTAAAEKSPPRLNSPAFPLATPPSRVHHSPQCSPPITGSPTFPAPGLFLPGDGAPYCTTTEAGNAVVVGEAACGRLTKSNEWTAAVARIFGDQPVTGTALHGPQGAPASKSSPASAFSTPPSASHDPPAPQSPPPPAKFPVLEPPSITVTMAPTIT